MTVSFGDQEAVARELTLTRDRLLARGGSIGRPEFEECATAIFEFGYLAAFATPCNGRALSMTPDCACPLCVLYTLTHGLAALLSVLRRGHRMIAAPFVDQTWIALEANNSEWTRLPCFTSDSVTQRVGHLGGVAAVALSRRIAAGWQPEHNEAVDLLNTLSTGGQHILAFHCVTTGIPA